LAYRRLDKGDQFWRRSNQMGVLNTDLGKQLGAEQVSSRLWRLEPGQASTKHRHRTQEELYVLLEGRGRARVGDEVLDFDVGDSLVIEPDTVRQLFNDTNKDQLWLVFGAPKEAVTSTLEMTEDDLAFMYPDGPKALPPELE
jgi:quercetin dioxygenase-like cupin family protein